MANNEVVLPEFGTEPFTYSYGNLIEYSSGLKIPSAGAGKAMAREILELRKQLDAQWISVEERLPPDDEMVLTYGFSDALRVIYWRQEVARYLSPDELEYWTNGHIMPTHWRPLPSPPSTTEGR